MAAQTQRAVLAGGCFWGMEELIHAAAGRDGDPGRIHRG